MRTKRVLLVGSMVLVTANIWTGSPLLALWIGSRVQPSSGPSMTAVGLVAVTLAVFSYALVKLLAWLDAVYGRTTGTRSTVSRHVPWLRSMRGERPHDDAGEGPRLAPLDYILVGGVVICFLLFEFWFFFLSGSPIDQRSGRD